MIVPGRLILVLGNVLGNFDPIQGINVRIRSWTSVWRSNGRTLSPFILEADLFQFRNLEYCGHVEAILVVSHTDDLLVLLISLGLAFLKV